ncbi:MAG: non-canonical purine NTP pyrophosphatase [Cyanobacteriota bacterium]
MKELFFATGNKNKVLEVEKILNFKIIQFDVDLLEIQSINVEEVVKHKIIEAYNIIKKPVLVEDTALSIVAWNNLPGALIKYFIQSVGNDGFIKMLNDFENKTAIAKTSLAYFDGKNLIIKTGEIKGCISDKITGSNGFGWDNIFIPDNNKKTFAEMDYEEKNLFSMRRIALESLIPFIPI